ncbi:MAG: hypothetical protein K6T75_09945 [Acetobacteraceae bacterium]|nr:hypothetical protein [Acetobacteraceae bacterium]
MEVCDRILVLREGAIQAEFERSQFSKELINRATFGQRGEAAAVRSPAPA